MGLICHLADCCGLYLCKLYRKRQHPDKDPGRGVPLAPMPRSKAPKRNPKRRKAKQSEVPQSSRSCQRRCLLLLRCGEQDLFEARHTQPSLNSGVTLIQTLNWPSLVSPSMSSSCRGEMDGRCHLAGAWMCLSLAFVHVIRVSRESLKKHIGWALTFPDRGVPSRGPHRLCITELPHADTGPLCHNLIPPPPPAGRACARPTAWACGSPVVEFSGSIYNAPVNIRERL